MSSTAGPTEASPRTESTDVDVRLRAEAPWWRKVLQGSAAWVLGLNIVLILVFTLLSPGGVFWSPLNLQNLLLNSSQALLLALAMSLLLGAGLIDLSVGANLVLSSVVAGIVTMKAAGGELAIFGESGGPYEFTNVAFAILLGLLAGVITGLLFGLINGAIIAYLKVNSLIATLGTMSVGTGVVLVITRGANIGGLPPELQATFGQARIGVIPVQAIIAIGLAVVVWAIVRYLRFGLHTLTIGSSLVSAERAGIKVKIHILKLNALTGALCGLAGFLNLAQFGGTSINGHTNDALAAITAAVIGGAALTGGRMNVIGTIWGTALAAILLSGLVVIGVSAFWQLVAVGTILIVAVAVDQFRRRREPSS